MRDRAVTGLECRLGRLNGGLFQARCGLRFSLRAYLDVINHLHRAGGFRHAGGRTLVLGDIGIPFPGDDAMGHFVVKSFFADLRFRKLRANRRIDLRVARRGAVRGCAMRGAGRERGGNRSETKRKRQGESQKSTNHSVVCADVICADMEVVELREDISQMNIARLVVTIHAALISLMN